MRQARVAAQVCTLLCQAKTLTLVICPSCFLKIGHVGMGNSFDIDQMKSHHRTETHFAHKKMTLPVDNTNKGS